MAKVGLYVFGTSILWGQGHNDEDKIHTKFRKWLERKHQARVSLQHLPHSGAILDGKSRAKRLYGEVPDAFPAIARQIRQAREAREHSVYVLLDGGINDVGVFNIINPLYSQQQIRRQTKKFCHDELLKMLLQLGQKYPGAETFVLGYYQILASRIRGRSDQLERLLYSLRVCKEGELDDIDFVGRAVANTKLFWKESDRHIRQAAEDAKEQIDGQVTFVPSTFSPLEGLFGKRSLLWAPGQVDPKLDDRVLPCTRALAQGRSGLHCYVAAIGHPNRRGVNRYVKSLKERMR